jgi:hypothetical protein
MVMAACKQLTTMDGILATIVAGGQQAQFLISF